MCGQSAMMLFMDMLNCTDTVYILLLHSGLHLLHALSGQKSAYFMVFYCWLWKLKEKKKQATVIIQDLIIRFFF